MKITMYTGRVPSTTFIDLLINGLAERGHNLIVIGKKSRNFLYHRNVQTIVIPKTKFAQLLIILFSLSHATYSQLKKIKKISNSLTSFYHNLLFYLPILTHKPDWVHLQWASGLYKRNLLFELFPGKIMISLRGSHINYTPIIRPEIAETYRELFPQVRRFHAVSKAMANEATCYGAASSNIHVIYTSVSDDLVDSKYLEKQNGDLKILVVGRFHWVKGYNYLIDALALLKKKLTAFHVLLIAGKDIPEEILYKIHIGKLVEYIEILDSLPHDKVLEKISSADLMLLPSVNEGIANVVIEAMALGTPVISSDCGGMGEVINDGVNGMLFKNRNPDSLSEKILEFNELSRDSKLQMARNAQRTIARDFSRKRMLDEFEKFYN